MQEDLKAATATAHDLGLTRVVHATAASLSTSHETRHIKLISRNALSHLRSLQGVSGAPKLHALVDVRRHDERALFGSIRGSQHVPLDTLLIALHSSPRRFQALTGFPPWSKSTLLVFHSRCNKRARWAALLAAVQGMHDLLPLTPSRYRSLKRNVLANCI
jgi:hypothetical protein